ncbi:uncharacterized protein [Lolium perenne]|uniref:uncharacterized protein isoform X1 n=1 Tax=Lolium perenne TaxID=4522 RepID=UPI0021F63B22|nr:uncharacterized protein LOC127308246 isoform X2 [Lolium perenne]XP_051194983.1 uncharacterized protein LOC127308247 isoform X2 [Lolium perenne]XP_051194984.1 uncharacterized protein LOC127308247 isoform X2 [Lolium perenne]
MVRRQPGRAGHDACHGDSSPTMRHPRSLRRQGNTGEPTSKKRWRPGDCGVLLLAGPFSTAPPATSSATRSLPPASLRGFLKADAARRGCSDALPACLRKCHAAAAEQVVAASSPHCTLSGGAISVLATILSGQGGRLNDRQDGSSIGVVLKLEYLGTNNTGQGGRLNGRQDGTST